MLMNSIEYWAMNNPLRGLVQRHYEAPRLRRLSNGPANDILEIGCGQGAGARIIYDLFGPQRYVGIDLDPSGERLFATSRQNKTVDIIQLSFIKKINTNGSKFKGPADAPVTIAVFSEFQ